MSTKNHTHETAIFDLWLNWVIAGGALILPILLSVYIRPLLIPLISLALAGGLLAYDRASLRSHTAVCPLILTIATRSLFYSALIMIVISLIYARGVIWYLYDDETINTAIPFVTLLIVAPVLFLTTAWSHIRGKRYSACQRCVNNLGSISERGLLGKIFSQESRYQRYFMLGISGVLTIIAWGYYTYFYINVNINIPDRFFFGWIPVILYLISVFYLGARCFTLWAYYCQDNNANDMSQGALTSIRILLISGDKFYLAREEEYNDTPDGYLYDTTATVTIGYHKEVSIEKATTCLRDISRMDDKDFTMRFMYESREASGERNTFHYICCPDSTSTMEKSALRGRWYNLSQVERLLHNRELTPMLASEIHRLHTITMAWKTYDAEGRRLYKVKNYHPIFRLDGICDWDVDFNSPKWLDVARLNEDKRFFRLRKLWRSIYTVKS